jgi:hypothetical protein
VHDPEACILVFVRMVRAPIMPDSRTPRAACGSLPTADRQGAKRQSWFGLFLIFGVCGLYLTMFARLLWRVGDEGAIVYGAQRVLEGQVPYRDFVEVITPGSFYWLAVYFKVFGTSWFALRAHLVLSGALISVLVYCLTRVFQWGRFSALPCAVFTVLGLPLWPASSHHWDSLLFGLAATLCFLTWQRSGRPAFLYLSGAGAALTTCVMQPKGGALIVALAAALVVSRFRNPALSLWQNAGRLLPPYALTLATVALCFNAAGVLGDMFVATVAWPLTHYHSLNRLPYGAGAFTLPIATSLHVMTGKSEVLIGLAAFVSFWPFLMVLLLPASVLLLLALAHRRGTLATLLREPTLVTLLMAGCALWLAELQRPDFYHLMWGSPLLLIAACVLIRRVLSRRTQNVVCWALSFSVAVFGTMNAAATLDARETLRTRRGNVSAASPDAALAFLVDHVPPDTPVFVYPYYPMYYYLANVRNATRYSELLYGFNTPEQFEEVIAALERERVEYVLWDTVVSGENLKAWFPTYVHPADRALRLEKYLTDTYVEVRVANGFRVMRRRGR